MAAVIAAVGAVWAVWLWFNHRRLHGEIGMVPPVELEAQHYRQNVAVTETATQ